MPKLYWSELASHEFDALDPERCVAILPVAAHEQHGPHLPAGVDTILNEGMLAQTVAILPADLQVLILPMQAVGKSNEHIRSKGTLTYSAETAIRMWVELGHSVHRAGLRKLVLVNSHGGNVDALGIVARELRVACGMLVVQTAWRRFGLPPGLYSETEQAHGVHAGDIETSMMLHFRPDLVNMAAAENFVSSGERMADKYKHLRPTGLHAYGWIAPDLNPKGAVGDASLATAEKGRLTAQFQALRFVELLRDVTDFPLTELA